MSVCVDIKSKKDCDETKWSKMVEDRWRTSLWRGGRERGTVNMKVKHKQMRGITMGWT